jgi:4-hydroxy-3-polyprenylbenzoate decarboxylase
MGKRLIIGITGASGVIYGIRALEALKQNPDIETQLVLSARPGSQLPRRPIGK